MPALPFKRSRSKENLKSRGKSTDPAPTSISTTSATADDLGESSPGPSASAGGAKSVHDVTKQSSREGQDGRTLDQQQTFPLSPSKSRTNKSGARLFGAFRKKERKESLDAGGLQVISKSSNGSTGDLLDSSTDLDASAVTGSSDLDHAASVVQTSPTVAARVENSPPRTSAAVVAGSHPKPALAPTSPSSSSSRPRLDLASKLSSKSSAKSPIVESPRQPSPATSPSASRPSLPDAYSGASGFSLKSFRRATTKEFEEEKTVGEPSPSSKPQSRRASMLSLDEFTLPPQTFSAADSSAPTTPGTPSMSVARFRAAARARMASESGEDVAVGSPRSRRASTLEPLYREEVKLSEEEDNPYFRDASSGTGTDHIANYSPISPGLVAARSRAEELALLEAQMRTLPRTLARVNSDNSESRTSAAGSPAPPSNRWEAGADRSMSSTSVPKLKHSSSLARLANLPNESALSDEDGPPPLPQKTKDPEPSSAADSYFPPLPVKHSSSASFSGTPSALSPIAGRSRTNTTASHQKRGLVSKKASSSSIGYQGHLAAVRAAAEASAASYDRIHGTQTPPDAFKEIQMKQKEDLHSVNRGAESPRASRGFGADSARILASFDQKNGPPQTLLDALARLEKERAPRSSPLLSHASSTKVWGAPNENQSDFSSPRLPWIPLESSQGRRVASESSAPNNEWRTTASSPGSPSTKTAEIMDQNDGRKNNANASDPFGRVGSSTDQLPAANPSAAPRSPKEARQSLSARLAQAVASRPASPGTSRPSSPDQKKSISKNSHRKSSSTSNNTANGIEALNKLYAVQLSNLSGVSDLGLPLAPDLNEDLGSHNSSLACAHQDVTAHTSVSPSPKRDTSLFSESNRLQLSTISNEDADEKPAQDGWNGNRALGPYPTSLQSPNRRFSHLLS